MTAKNNFKKQRKELKRNKERKERSAKRLHNDRSKVTAKHPEYTDEFIQKYVAEHGIGRAVADLKLRADNNDFTNKNVLDMIKETIPPMIRVHAGIEVYDILHKEGKVELSPETQALFETFDTTAVEMAQTVQAIISLVEAGKSPEQYHELVDNFANNSGIIFGGLVPSIIQVIEVAGPLMDEYQSTHTPEGSNMHDFMQERHAQRMERVIRAKLEDIAQQSGKEESIVNLDTAEEGTV